MGSEGQPQRGGEAESGGPGRHQDADDGNYTWNLLRTSGCGTCGGKFRGQPRHCGQRTPVHRPQGRPPPPRSGIRARCGALSRSGWTGPAGASSPAETEGRPARPESRPHGVTARLCHLPVLRHPEPATNQPPTQLAPPAAPACSSRNLPQAPGAPGPGASLSAHFLAPTRAFPTGDAPFPLTHSPACLCWVSPPANPRVPLPPLEVDYAGATSEGGHSASPPLRQKQAQPAQPSQALTLPLRRLARPPLCPPPSPSITPAEIRAPAAGDALCRPCPGPVSSPPDPHRGSLDKGPSPLGPWRAPTPHALTRGPCRARGGGWPGAPAPTFNGSLPPQCGSPQAQGRSSGRSGCVRSGDIQQPRTFGTTDRPPVPRARISGSSPARPPALTRPRPHLPAPPGQPALAGARLRLRPRPSAGRPRLRPGSQAHAGRGRGLELHAAPWGRGPPCSPAPWSSPPAGRSAPGCG